MKRCQGKSARTSESIQGGLIKLSRADSIYNRSVIGFQDLSVELQKEVQELQKRMAVELQPLMLESTLSMQKILEALDHTSRLKLLRWFIESERKRLNTKKTLQNLFSNKSEPSDLSNMPPEELIITPPSFPDAKTSFFEDEDAFQ